MSWYRCNNPVVMEDAHGRPVYSSVRIDAIIGASPESATAAAEEFVESMPSGDLLLAISEVSMTGSGSSAIVSVLWQQRIHYDG